MVNVHLHTSIVTDGDCPDDGVMEGFVQKEKWAADIIHIVIQFDWSTRFLLWLVHNIALLSSVSDQLPWHHHENVKRCQQPHSLPEPRSQETFLRPLPIQLLLILHQASPVRLLLKEPGYLRQTMLNISLRTSMSNVYNHLNKTDNDVVRDRTTRLRNHYNLLASTLRIRGEARMSRVPSHLRGIKIKELREMQKRGLAREKQLLTDVLGTRLLASANRPTLKRYFGSLLTLLTTQKTL